MTDPDLRIPFVDLKSQYQSIKPSIDAAIQNVIDETAFIRGEFVKKFEEDYARSYGVRNVISCGNGTDAIYIALKALGIGRGDEVITTALSWISTSEAITQTGARVVFVDIQRDYYNIDPGKIEQEITDRTKAIIPVHLYGQPADMEPIMDIAEDYDLYVIEDCAQAHFAEYRGRKVGTFGIAGTFSFYPGKNLGAYGDAGAIVTNDDELSTRVRRFANHGALEKHDHEIEGINSRMDGLQAAILSAKLPHLETWNAKRLEHARLYGELLRGVSDVERPKIDPQARHVFHLYVIRSEKRDELRAYLGSKGIATGIHYPTALPFLRAYAYLGHGPKDFSMAYDYQSKILSLPIYPEMTDEMIGHVADRIKEFLN